MSPLAAVGGLASGSAFLLYAVCNGAPLEPRELGWHVAAREQGSSHIYVGVSKIQISGAAQARYLLSLTANKCTILDTQIG